MYICNKFLKMARGLTNENFLMRLDEVHGKKFILDKTQYINTRTKVIVTCKTHGDFEIKPDKLLAGQGCASCARDKHKLTHITPDRLANMKRIHQDVYIYDDLQVIESRINIVCKEHGNFIQSIHHHENGHGCPKCARTPKLKTKECRTCGNQRPLADFKSRFKTCNFCLDNPPKINSKVCSVCGIDKPLEDFPKRKDSVFGYRNECKSCKSGFEKIYKKDYRQENKKILRKKDLIYRKERAERDDLYKATLIARTVIRKAITRGGYKKNSRTENILGCDYLTFKQHIESMFVDGMSWQNRHEWHIDHIIPISSAMDESHLLRLNHFTNLQPLWIQENLIKSNTIV